jgi:hypothetical protein
MANNSVGVNSSPNTANVEIPAPDPTTPIVEQDKTEISNELITDSSSGLLVSSVTGSVAVENLESGPEDFTLDDEENFEEPFSEEVTDDPTTYGPTDVPPEAISEGPPPLEDAGNPLEGSNAIDFAIALNPPQLGIKNPNFRETFNTSKRGNKNHEYMARRYNSPKDNGGYVVTTKPFGFNNWPDVPFCALGISYCIIQAIDALDSKHESLGSKAFWGKLGGKKYGSKWAGNASAFINFWWGANYDNKFNLLSNSDYYKTQWPNNRLVSLHKLEGDYTNKSLTSKGIERLNKIKGWKGASYSWLQTSDPASGHIGLVLDVGIDSSGNITSLYTCEFNTGLKSVANGGQLGFKIRSLKPSSFLFKYPQLYICNITGIPGCNFNSGFGLNGSRILIDGLTKSTFN